MVQSNIQERSDTSQKQLHHQSLSKIDPTETPASTAQAIEKPKFRPVVMLITLGLHIGALPAFLPQFFNWQAVGVAVFLYVITIGGQCCARGRERPLGR